MAWSHTVSVAADPFSDQDWVSILVHRSQHIRSEVSVPGEALEITLLNCACFIDPTTLAVHPQLTALAIDGKGFTTFVAINKLIHIPSLLAHTDITQSNILAVFTFRGGGSLLG